MLDSTIADIVHREEESKATAGPYLWSYTPFVSDARRRSQGEA